MRNQVSGIRYQVSERKISRRGKKILLIFTLILVLGCKKKEEEKPIELPISPPPYIEVEKPEYETYYYFDMGRRDPFIPLEELERMKQEQMLKERERVEREKPKEEGLVFSLTGLVWDSKDVVGIVEGETENYLFVKDKLVDKDGEFVPDIDGYP
ncbi:TPA: hypothetical protein DCX16_05950, partial [bacterium]|nr:hypothetical protein [bacterium]